MSNTTGSHSSSTFRAQLDCQTFASHGVSENRRRNGAVLEVIDEKQRSGSQSRSDLRLDEARDHASGVEALAKLDIVTTFERLKPPEHNDQVAHDVAADFCLSGFNLCLVTLARVEEAQSAVLFFGQTVDASQDAPVRDDHWHRHLHVVNLVALVICELVRSHAVVQTTTNPDWIVDEVQHLLLGQADTMPPDYRHRVAIILEPLLGNVLLVGFFIHGV